jgi:hypothetical protein
MSQTSVACLGSLAGGARAILIALLFATSLAAQQSGPPGTPGNDPNDPINQEKANKADMRNREWLMGNSRKPIRRTGWGPQAAAMPQISEDFEKIQLVDKELMTAVFANNVINHKQIGKATADIERRAARLISNLGYPEAPETEKAAPEARGDTDIRLALSKLDSAIVSFVTNPIFKTDQKVVNTALAMKVSKDLRTVVKLSSHIRRQAEVSARQQAQP